MATGIRYVLLFLLWCNLGKNESPRWDLMHQTDYDVDVHHIEIPWYNSSYMKIEKFEAVKYNRTCPRALNSSTYLFKEIGRNLKLKVQLYKFLSNRYQYFPFTATFLLCEEYDKNTFGAKDSVAKYTNFKPCPQKPGRLTTTYLLIDYSQLPPLMPSGEYKVSAEVMEGNWKIIDVDIFAVIKSKPKIKYEE